MQTIKPSKYQIYARPLEAEVATKSGILLTDNSRDKPHMASVINVGSAVTEYKRHDTIVYKEYAITEIKLNGEDLILLSEDDVQGTVLEVDGE